jgi:glyoxylase-like metal-dependent hydrolase (beta-lactamase superfamily II)
MAQMAWKCYNPRIMQSHSQSDRQGHSFLEKTIVVGPFQCNCRLLACPQTGEAALVDPGDEPAEILAAVQAMKTPSGVPIRVKYLLHTHGHLDHIGGTRSVREALTETRPKIALHRGDEPLYLNLQMQGNLFGMRFDQPLPVDHFLEDGEGLQVGELRFSILHTPGHSPGSVCIRLHENSEIKVQETLFSGDTLFQGSVGRTDLWGANQDLMFKNIRQRILTLDGDTRVCPGHGPDTSIGVEKHSNPFLI